MPDKDVSDYDAIRLMEEVGGSFASNLARAWMHADLTNRRRLESAFGGLLEEFRQLASQRKGIKHGNQ